MDLSKLPDSQRQELEQLQKQFQEHQQKQQESAQQPPPPYVPFHAHQPYDPSYYYNYQHPSNQYYQNYYSNSYPPGPNEESGSGALGLGQFQDPYVSLGGPPGINPSAAAAAVAALSQLTQFAGAMGGGQGHFRPPVGHPPSYRGVRSFNTGPPFRGRGNRGRGKGRGRGGRRESSSAADANAQRTAWCEVCRVDCTTNEVLDEHNKGKRHKRNLQKLQDRRKVQTTSGSDTAAPEVENNNNNNPDTQQQTEVVGDDNNKEAAEAKENENQEKKPSRMKRKMKGRIRVGGAKRMRPTGPRNRKVVIPLVCDLCNIKCDTQEVFDRHAAGKKHMSKLKKFEGHQAMYGPTAVQALYPPNPLSQTLAPQPAPYYGASSSYPAPPPEAYLAQTPDPQLPPHQAQNPNPQLADAPLEFSTQNAAAAVLTG